MTFIFYIFVVVILLGIAELIHRQTQDVANRLDKISSQIKDLGRDVEEIDD